MVESNDDQQLSPAVYDNSAYPYVLLEPGQSMIKGDSLFIRLHQDLHYENYVSENRVIQLIISAESVEKGDTQGQREVIDSLIINEEYYQKARRPYFAYRLSFQGKKISGKQLLFSFSALERTSPGQAYQLLCTQALPIIKELKPACCSGSAWEGSGLKAAVTLPPLDISPKSYHYAGFTGLVDITFEHNSSAIGDSSLMLDRVQRQIDRFSDLDYEVAEIMIAGYASIKGEAELNQALSTNRVRTLYRGLTLRNPHTSITYEGRGEDWALTESLLKAQPLSAAQQHSIEQILRSSITPDEKEKRLEALNLGTACWEAVLPPTRHTLALLKFSYQGREDALSFFPDSLPLASDVLAQAALWQIEVSPYHPKLSVERQMQALDALISEKPSAALYAMRATYLAAQGQYTSAIEAMREAEKIEIQKWDVYRWALQLMVADSWTPAEQLLLARELQQALSQKRNQLQLLPYMALIQEKLGNLSLALSYWNKIESLRPLTAAELNNRGIIYLKTQQLPRAFQAFEAALGKESQLGEAHINLALLNAYRGFSALAIHHLERGLSLNSSWKKEILQNPVLEYIRKDARFEWIEN